MSSFSNRMANEYRTNDPNPVDDEHYINEDKLNKYKELIKIKRSIEIKLIELQTVMQGDGNDAKIENADLNELSRHLKNYEDMAQSIDDTFDSPENYTRSWHNLSFIEKTLHPFQVIYKPFVKLFRWISNNKGKIKAGDPTHGGKNLGYLKELINQMIAITSLTYKLEDKLLNPPQNTSYESYFSNINGEITQIIESVNNMSDGTSSFYDLFPDTDNDYTNDPDKLKHHWLYFSEDNDDKLPPILRIKQIDDIRTRVLLPFMKSQQNKLFKVGETNAYDNAFSNPVLSEDVHQYLFNVINNKQDLKNFEILHQKDSISAPISDGIKKINSVQYDALMSKETTDPTGIYALFNMNSNPGWQTLEDGPKKILTKIITGALNNSRINVSRIITENLNLSEQKKETVKNNAITKLNELLSNEKEKRKTAVSIYIYSRII